MKCKRNSREILQQFCFCRPMARWNSTWQRHNDFHRKHPHHYGSFPFNNSLKLSQLSSNTGHYDPYKRYLKMIISFIQSPNEGIPFLWSFLWVLGGVIMAGMLRAVASWLPGFLWWFGGLFGQFSGIISQQIYLSGHWSMFHGHKVNPSQESRGR